MTRWKPPHPAQTIHPPRTCPNGPRYNTHTLAHQHTITLGTHDIPTNQPTPCPTCGGWHIRSST